MIISKDNTLAVRFPKIASEWHPTKNGDLRPEDVTYGSNKVVWWLKESCGHIWDASIKSRTHGESCPYCAGKRVDESNSLLALFPEIAAEWHPSLNNDERPSNCAAFSNSVKYWLGRCNHIWDMIVSDRTYNGQGCPYCAGKKVDISNCAATLYPHLLTEWHSTKNKITLYDVTSGSDKLMYWNCSKGHEWQEAVYRRAIREFGCPYCSGSRVHLTTCLATTHPDLICEWDYELNKNITPYDVTYGSNIAVNWKCLKGHKWSALISSRASSGRNCPYCREPKGEIVINKLLLDYNFKFYRQHSFKDCRHVNPLFFDFAVQTSSGIKLIEFNGNQHYSPNKIWFKENADYMFQLQQIRDKIKISYCTKNNIPLLVIPYWSMDKISEIVLEFLK